MRSRPSALTLMAASWLAAACDAGGDTGARAGAPADSALPPNMVTGTTGAPGPGTAGTPGTPGAPAPDTIGGASAPPPR